MCNKVLNILLVRLCTAVSQRNYVYHTCNNVLNSVLRLDRVQFRIWSGDSTLYAANVQDDWYAHDHSFL